ncbi:21391_t:CDS:2 [Racocetra persica]|uniref:21391_t:CDS:1 n=1 Tax=Racocetra persica TaxID=160502 RepID=A0ACA9MY87_9GLOM|nr:21391_t:CDS:2 [Racocetra persica]
MNEPCQLVISQKGHSKLMIDEPEYCKTRAITILLNGLHYLKKIDKYEHASQTGNGEIAQVVARIKQQARDTQDAPSKIIQNNITTIPKNLSPYMPTQEAL